MKTILLLISMIAMSANSFTQDYIPLVKEGASWLIYSFDDTENPEEYWNFIIQEDTLVNSHLYNKVLLRKLNPIENSETYEVLEESLFALLREEIDSRKVYCIKLQDYKWGMYNCEINQEFLLYDFSYSIGDEIVTCNILSDPGMPIIIQDISQELIYNETRTILDYGGFLGYWIEGIGQSSGLFTNTTTQPLIASVDVVILEYCSDANDCDILLDNTDLQIDNNVKLFPNPVGTTIYIDDGKQVFNSIQIIDALGHLVYDIETSEQEIDVHFLESGMYFLIVGDDKNTSQYFKFLKL